MNLFNFFKKKAALPKGDAIRPIKDPKDYTLTRSSSRWTTDDYCPSCKHSTAHDEIMSAVCNNCGYVGAKGEFLMQRQRSYRQIWNGERWQYQIRYRDGEEILDKMP